MSGNTSIQWTDTTWNPTTGCTRVSAGCDHCYAFQLHDQRHIAWKRGRWKDAPAQYRKPFSHVQLLPQRLADPLSWRDPQRIFVNSMSDLFHESVPDSFIAQVFGVMAMTPRHTYQILTKRPERMLDWMQRYDGTTCVTAFTQDYRVQQTTIGRATWRWNVRRVPERRAWPLSNVWLGVSVENQTAADERIPLLLEAPAAVRFLSCEPLLDAVDLREYLQLTETNKWDFGEGRTWGYDEWSGGFANWSAHTKVYDPQPGIHWVIIGGESGTHARPMEISWAESLLAQCWEAQVATFVKQMGAVWAKANHASNSHGSNIAEWPKSLRFREYPQLQTGGDAA